MADIVVIDYHWFYSAFSQSLAALVGVVGMFAVYRLQVQKSNIEKSFRRLQRYSEHIMEMTFNILPTEKQILEKAQKEIEKYAKRILDSDKIIKDRRDELEKDSRKKEMIEKAIENETKKKNGVIKLTERMYDEIGMTSQAKKYNEKIKDSAFFVIVYLTTLFFSSLLCLSTSTYLNTNIILGYKIIVIMFALLAGALYFLVRYCVISFDVGISKTKLK